MRRGQRLADLHTTFHLLRRAEAAAAGADDGAAEMAPSNHHPYWEVPVERVEALTNCGIVVLACSVLYCITLYYLPAPKKSAKFL